MRLSNRVHILKMLDKFYNPSPKKEHPKWSQTKCSRGEIDDCHYKLSDHDLFEQCREAFFDHMCLHCRQVWTL